MTRRVLIGALVAAWFCFAPSLLAQGKQCNDADETQAEKDVDLLKTWDQIYRSYKKFAPRCDDGAVAEGYSDAVGKLLAYHWHYFPRLMKLANDDKGFKQFVVRHVDETLPDPHSRK